MRRASLLVVFKLWFKYIFGLRTVPTNTKVFFARFMTMRKKQILARAVEIQKGT